MEYLLNFSMPFFTPEATIRQLSARKAVKQRLGPQKDEVKAGNRSLTLSGSQPVKARPQDFRKNSKDHPPTTL